MSFDTSSYSSLGRKRLPSYSFSSGSGRSTFSSDYGSSSNHGFSPGFSSLGSTTSLSTCGLSGSVYSSRPPSSSFVSRSREESFLSNSMIKRDTIINSLVRTSHDLKRHDFLPADAASRSSRIIHRAYRPVDSSRTKTADLSLSALTARSSTDFSFATTSSYSSFATTSSYETTYRSPYRPIVIQRPSLDNYTPRPREERQRNIHFKSIRRDRPLVKFCEKEDVNPEKVRELLDSWSPETIDEHEDDYETKKRDSVRSNDSGIGSFRSSFGKGSSKKSGEFLSYDLSPTIDEKDSGTEDNEDIASDRRYGRYTKDDHISSVDEGVHMEAEYESRSPRDVVSPLSFQDSNSRPISRNDVPNAFEKLEYAHSVRREDHSSKNSEVLTPSAASDEQHPSNSEIKPPVPQRFSRNSNRMRRRSDIDSFETLDNTSLDVSLTNNVSTLTNRRRDKRSDSNVIEDEHTKIIETEKAQIDKDLADFSNETERIDKTTLSSRENNIEKAESLATCVDETDIKTEITSSDLSNISKSTGKSKLSPYDHKFSTDNKSESMKPNDVEVKFSPKENDKKIIKKHKKEEEECKKTEVLNKSLPFPKETSLSEIGETSEISPEKVITESLRKTTDTNKVELSCKKSSDLSNEAIVEKVEKRPNKTEVEKPRRVSVEQSSKTTVQLLGKNTVESPTKMSVGPFSKVKIETPSKTKTDVPIENTTKSKFKNATELSNKTTAKDSSDTLKIKGPRTETHVEPLNKITPAKTDKIPAEKITGNLSNKTQIESPIKSTGETSNSVPMEPPNKTKTESQKKSKPEVPSKHTAETLSKPSIEQPFGKVTVESPTKLKDEVNARSKTKIQSLSKTAVVLPSKTKVESLSKTATDLANKTEGESVSKAVVDSPSKTKMELNKPQTVSLIKAKVEPLRAAADDSHGKTEVESLSKVAADSLSKTKAESLNEAAIDSSSKTKVEPSSETAIDSPSKTKVELLSKTAGDSLGKTKVELSKAQDYPPSKAKVEPFSKTAAESSGKTKIQSPHKLAPDMPNEGKDSTLAIKVKPDVTEKPGKADVPCVMNDAKPENEQGNSKNGRKLTKDIGEITGAIPKTKRDNFIKTEDKNKRGAGHTEDILATKKEKQIKDSEFSVLHTHQINEVKCKNSSSKANISVSSSSNLLEKENDIKTGTAKKPEIISIFPDNKINKNVASEKEIANISTERIATECSDTKNIASKTTDLKALLRDSKPLLTSSKEKADLRNTEGKDKFNIDRLKTKATVEKTVPSSEQKVLKEETSKELPPESENKKPSKDKNMTNLENDVSLHKVEKRVRKDLKKSPETADFKRDMKTQKQTATSTVSSGSNKDSKAQGAFPEPSKVTDVTAQEKISFVSEKSLSSGVKGEKSVNELQNKADSAAEFRNKQTEKKSCATNFSETEVASIKETPVKSGSLDIEENIESQTNKIVTQKDISVSESKSVFGVEEKSKDLLSESSGLNKDYKAQGIFPEPSKATDVSAQEKISSLSEKSFSSSVADEKCVNELQNENDSASEFGNKQTETKSCTTNFGETKKSVIEETHSINIGSLDTTENIESQTNKIVTQKDILVPESKCVSGVGEESKDLLSENLGLSKDSNSQDTFPEPCKATDAAAQEKIPSLAEKSLSSDIADEKGVNELQSKADSAFEFENKQKETKSCKTDFSESKKFVIEETPINITLLDTEEDIEFQTDKIVTQENISVPEPKCVSDVEEKSKDVLSENSESNKDSNAQGTFPEPSKETDVTSQDKILSLSEKSLSSDVTGGKSVNQLKNEADSASEFENEQKEKKSCETDFSESKKSVVEEIPINSSSSLVPEESTESQRNKTVIQKDISVLEHKCVSGAEEKSTDLLSEKSSESKNHRHDKNEICDSIPVAAEIPDTRLETECNRVSFVIKKSLSENFGLHNSGALGKTLENFKLQKSVSAGTKVPIRTKPPLPFKTVIPPGLPFSRKKRFDGHNLEKNTELRPLQKSCTEGKMGFKGDSSERSKLYDLKKSSTTGKINFEADYSKSPKLLDLKTFITTECNRLVKKQSIEDNKPLVNSSSVSQENSDQNSVKSVDQISSHQKIGEVEEKVSQQKESQTSEENIPRESKENSAAISTELSRTEAKDKLIHTSEVCETVPEIEIKAETFKDGIEVNSTPPVQKITTEPLGKESGEDRSTTCREISAEVVRDAEQLSKENCPAVTKTVEAPTPPSSAARPCVPKNKLDISDESDSFVPMKHFVPSSSSSLLAIEKVRAKIAKQTERELLEKNTLDKVRARIARKQELEQLSKPSAEKVPPKLLQDTKKNAVVNVTDSSKTGQRGGNICSVPEDSEPQDKEKTVSRLCTEHSPSTNILAQCAQPEQISGTHSTSITTKTEQNITAVIPTVKKRPHDDKTVETIPNTLPPNKNSENAADSKENIEETKPKVKKPKKPKVEGEEKVKKKKKKKDKPEETEEKSDTSAKTETAETTKSENTTSANASEETATSGGLKNSAVESIHSQQKSDLSTPSPGVNNEASATTDTYSVNICNLTPPQSPAISDPEDVCDHQWSENKRSESSESFRQSRNSSANSGTIRFRKYAVEDFHFLKVLGRGSYGKVMLAELKGSTQYFAVKCLKKDVVLEDNDVECTMIERKVLTMGSSHPYLCTLFCTFQSQSHLFFVMEYLSGGDLMFHIQQCGRFDQERARFYAAEIVCALKYLHKRGIVYRDAKLDNICLDADGHIRLVDFGFCKLRIYKKECLPKNLCGTPDYMAPEIIKGHHYNQSVDWWSFGVLLYEMLIGQSPFNGTDEEELFWSVCNEEAYYPRFLSKEAKHILILLLEKNPEKRLGMPGCVAGDIIYQPFFRYTNWEKVEKKEVKPPFKPKLKSETDVSNFDSDFTMEKAMLTPIDKQILDSMDQNQFEGFSYTNPRITD